MTKPKTIRPARIAQHHQQFPHDAARQLAELGSQRQLAKRLSVSHVAVGGWLRGDFEPTLEQRRRVREVLGIDEVAWGRKPADPVAELVPSDPATAPLPDGADELDALIRQLRSARTEPNVSPGVLAKVGTLEVRAIAAREALRESRDAAARSPELLACFERMSAALLAHPLAMVDVMAAFTPLGMSPFGASARRHPREEFPELCAAVEAANAALSAALTGAGHAS